MRRELLAGLDLGTTSAKAVLISVGGDEVASGSAAMTWTTSEFGAETSASSILDAARRALVDALSSVPDDRVVALGVASMAEAGVLVGADDQPLGPVIAWHDHRDEAELDDLIAQLGGDVFSARTGLPLWTQWSLTKHRWLMDHVPAARAAVRRYNVAEWVARSFGAQPVTELSPASRTGWLDLASGRPWSESMAWSGAPEGLLGDLVTAGTPIGTAATSGDLSAIDGATLTIAGHDHQAAVVGVGATGAGDEFDSCGTAEAFVRTVEPRMDPASVLALTRAGVTVGWHVVRDRWSLLGATQGGLVLGRVQAALGVDRAGMAALDAAALTARDNPTALEIDGAADVTVIPGANPGEVWRAAATAVTVQAKQLGDILDAASGPRRHLTVAGGWTNSTMLMAAKAEAFGALRTTATKEVGARGAALLAGIASRAYETYADLPPDAHMQPSSTASAMRPPRHPDQIEDPRP